MRVVSLSGWCQNWAGLPGKVAGKGNGLAISIVSIGSIISLPPPLSGMLYRNIRYKLFNL